MSGLRAKGSFVGSGHIADSSDIRNKMSRELTTLAVLIIIVATMAVVITMQGFSSSVFTGRTKFVATHVVINEVYYDAPTGYGEPQCEWIELYNPTSNDVDISGWNISDDPLPNGNVTEGAWQFPAGAIIPAYGYILVVNDATYKGEFNSLFPGVTPDFDTNTSNSIPDMSVTGSLKLANSGDDVHLFNSYQTEIDAMWYGSGGDMGTTNAAPDVSAGHSLARYYNAEDTDKPTNDFYDEFSPTPKTQNNQVVPEFTAISPILFMLIAIPIILKRRKHPF